MSETLPTFSLLETMLYEPENGIYLLDEHLNRLNTSAKQLFNISIDMEQCIQLIKQQIKPAETSASPARIRLLVDKHGQMNVEATLLPSTSISSDLLNTTWLPRVVLDTQPTDSNSIFVKHKTTYREIYNQARQRQGIPPPGQTTTDIFDVILWNQRGEITESTIANIAVETTSTDGTVYWKTPALSCGLLAGTLRQSLLASGLLREGIITRDALIQAAKQGHRICCFNSVRKMYLVQLVLPPHTTHSYN